MSLGKIIFITAVILVAIIFIMFPEARKLFSGITRLFIKDLATTPDGAAAIYEEKINEAQEKYNQADNALRKAAGKLDTEEKNLSRLEYKVKEVEKMCEQLVQAGNMDAAQIKADERSELLADIERSKKLIQAYSSAKLDALEVHKHCEQTLRKLKRESKEVVENMKVKEQLSEVYDSMDELKNVTATDKLLDSIKEKNKDLDSSVAGARVVHENRTSTKVQRANEQAKQLQNDDYLNSLKKKYNK